MRRIGLAAVLAISSVAAVAADKPTQFWNLTTGTIVSLRLAHAGQDAYGDNVAVGDADGVEHDERAPIVTLPSGRYDLELRYKGGRVCFVRHVKVETGKVFSVEDKDLTACNKK
jgi:hypothetical protein